MMMPPPGSHLTPNHDLRHSAPPENQITQQMHLMKLNQHSPHNTPIQNSMPYNPSNSPIHNPENLPPGIPNPQSPQHSNRAQMSTMVTYSSQPHVTYPYRNSNPQSIPPVSSTDMQPATIGQQNIINNNSMYPSQYHKVEQVIMHETIAQQQHVINSSVQSGGNQSQAYSTHPSLSNGNFTIGSSIGCERPQQAGNMAVQQMLLTSPNQNFSPVSNVQPHSVPPNAQFPSPSMNQNSNPMYNPAGSQSGMSPTFAGYQPAPRSMVTGQQLASNYPNLRAQGPQPLARSYPPNSPPLPGDSYSPNSPPQPGSYSSNPPPPPPLPGSYSSNPPPPPMPGSYSSNPPPPLGSHPPGSPSYSGMSPTYPKAGNAWQASQYQGEPPPSPGGYYGTQSASLPQQPQRMDLEQLPSTVLVRQENRKLQSGSYSTAVKGVPPPFVTTNFIAQDTGLCNPRFIRSSTYCLPNNPDMLKQTAVPFALTICPLANLNDGESEPPLCLYREAGPLRCKRCKAYVSPFMNFMEGGKCFQCAFCKVVTEVPEDYFSFLDGTGERTDKYHRPELCLGSYEFIATKEYCRNEELPNPPAYIFMIEVSHATFRNGLVPLLCENMKNVLQCLKNDEQNDTSKLRIGFVTYNNVLHFYNMKKNLTQPHIMVLSDVHNAFVPLLEGFLVTLDDAEPLVDCLMEHIPKLFVNEPATEIILGPVIQVGLEALKNANCSGKLFIFHATLPNADAPGKLQHRDGQKLLGTDKQKTVILPQNDFYSKLAEECVKVGCAVDLFLFPNAYLDVASISPVCRHTGGQLYKYTYFQSHTDGDRFLEDLERNVVTTTAFDAVLRLRTSAGISPVFYYGNFYMSNTTDIELSSIDGHKAVTIELAYDDKLPENETVYAQAALLYTSCTGERRIRVHNLSIATSVSMPDVYRCAELDTIINFLAKQTLKQLLEQNPQQIKANIITRSVKMLSCYRKNCASGTASGQLILPDSLKLLPLYINCLLKSDAIGGGPEMSLDDRNFAMLAVNSMDVRSTEAYFYPTLLPLHTVDVNSTEMPTPIRCSIEKLSDDGAYLLENGIYMFLWIGQAINPEWLHDLFGVQSTNLVEKEKTSLPELNTPLSKRIRQIIERLEDKKQWYMRLTVMVQGDKLEVVFRQFLMEDKGVDGSLSYVDFLLQLHREILKNL